MITKIENENSPISHKIRLLVVPSDRTGVGYFRSTKPHLNLEKMYPDEFHIDIDFEPNINSDEFLKQYDIIHYHRNIGDYDKMEELVLKFKSLGIISIMDIDDYWAPGTHHPAFNLFKHYKLDKKILKNIKNADNVLTTTQIFADEITKFNKNVSVIPNAIDKNEKQFLIKPEESKKIRIGWLGGSSHEKDIDLLSGLVNKLGAANLLDKIQFVLCGFDLNGYATNIDNVNNTTTQRAISPIESVWYKYEKIFTDNYTTISDEYKSFLMKFSNEEYPNVINEPYRRVWTKPVNNYASNYNLFDISLAPLGDNVFNKMKSQLKVIESGMFKKPIIAQDFGPYKLDVINYFEKGGVVNDKGNGFLVKHSNNHKDWFKYIKLLVDNPELITKIGNNLHDTVSDKFSLDSVTTDRRNYYLNLVVNYQKKLVSL